MKTQTNTNTHEHTNTNLAKPSASSWALTFTPTATGWSGKWTTPPRNPPRSSPRRISCAGPEATAQAEQVHSCYEAGPFGYGLHRQLTALGMHNLVVRPQKWDELGKGVKTDRTDALALVQRLDRYVRGNHKAFAVVLRAHARTGSGAQAKPPAGAVAGATATARSPRPQPALVSGGAWRAAGGSRRRGSRWHRQISPALREVLEVTAKLVLAVQSRSSAATARLQAATAQPRAVGALTSEMLRREVFDWNRFTNRRQVAS